MAKTHGLQHLGEKYKKGNSGHRGQNSAYGIKIGHHVGRDYKRG